MIDVPSRAETPIEPEIVGTATFAIVVSNTSMKVDKAVAKVKNTKGAPCSGGSTVLA